MGVIGYSPAEEEVCFQTQQTSPPIYELLSWDFSGRFVANTLQLFDDPNSSFAVKRATRTDVNNTAADGSGTLVTDPMATDLRKVVLPGKKKPSPWKPEKEDKAIVPPASVKGEENSGSKNAIPGKAPGAGAVAHNSVGELRMGSYVL
jgi:hypothetical protein